MPESKDSKDIPEKRSSPIGNIIESSLEHHTAFGESARVLSDISVKRVERLNRAREALDNALLNGTIGEEQAKEELDRLKEERKELEKESLERMQLMAQLNRDADTTRVLYMNRLMEKGKLDYDFHKHFTTLGTGSILFIAALSRLLFPDIAETESLILLFMSFALLIVSVMSAALAMRGSVVDAVLGTTSDITERVSDVSWSCFTVGILSFVLYTGINMAALQVEREWVLPLILAGGYALGTFGGRVRRKRRENRANPESS